MAPTIVAGSCGKERITALQRTRPEREIRLQTLIHFLEHLHRLIRRPPPVPVHPQFPLLTRHVLLQMFNPRPTHLNRAESRLQHEIGHRDIAGALQVRLPWIGLQHRQQRLRLLHRQMPAGVLPTAGSPLNEVGRIHEAPVERHELGQKLRDRREVAVLRARIRKALVEMRAVGVETDPVEAADVLIPPLLKPTDKGAVPLPVRAGCRGGWLLDNQLPGKFVEIDAQADQRRGREHQ